MCHLVHCWETSVIVLSERLNHGIAWHCWSGGGYSPEEGVATAAGAMYAGRPETGEVNLRAAFVLYKPSGANDSLTAEACALTTVHTWLSALHEDRLTFSTYADITAALPSTIHIPRGKLNLPSIRLPPNICSV